MKLISLIPITCAVLIMNFTACRKPTEMKPAGKLELPRQIQFQLYTDKNFANDNNNILFTLFIQNTRTNRVLWDSLLPVMKIKDIPDLAHKMVMEKTVPEDNGALLKVGFLYSIENVGNSWYFDSSKTDQPLKIVAFNFK